MYNQGYPGGYLPGYPAYGSMQYYPPLAAAAAAYYPAAAMPPQVRPTIMVSVSNSTLRIKSQKMHTNFKNCKNQQTLIF